MHSSVLYSSTECTCLLAMCLPPRSPIFCCYLWAAAPFSRAGDDLTRATGLGSSIKCDMACSNQHAPNGYCGGPLANTIYIINNGQPASPAPSPPVDTPAGPSPEVVPLSSLNITRLGKHCTSSMLAFAVVKYCFAWHSGRYGLFRCSAS